MKCVFLDKGSVDRGDIEFDTLKSVAETWTEYESTPPDKVEARIKNMDVVITNKVVLTKSLLSNASCLKLVCIAATGTNNVDITTANQHNITVCNVKDYATQSVVQHVFSLIFSLSNNLVNYHNRVHEGAWDRSNHFCLLDFPITELSGKTLGIIGYGVLGKAVAKAAQAFGINTLVAESLSGQPSIDRVPIQTLLQQSDIISLHCPLTVQTTHLINKKSFDLMKPSSIIINTARGGIINALDLLDALKENKIAGAGLDVLETEPPTDNPLINAKLPNLLITPHIAWASSQSRQNLINEIEKNIAAFIHGKERNIVT